MLRHSVFGGALAAAVFCACPDVAAGGYDELPDQGAQALGRGATFTAKADDTTALYYNVAGLARQRGTKLQISGNLQFDSYTFARAGKYPDDPKNASTPWGGQPFPVAGNTAGPFVLPMIAATTDLGMFERFTIGVGVWAPSAASRTFPMGIDGRPAPTRYEAVQSKGLIAFPTLAAAYRLTDHIDVGLAGHLVVVNIDGLSNAYVDPGGGACPTPEYYGCDTDGRLQVKGMGVAASAGILARPDPAFELGAQVKTPWTVQATGTISGRFASGAVLPEMPASLNMAFPLIVRAGARYIGFDAPTRASDASRERYDVELDATYEAWSSTNPGPSIQTTNPTTNQPTSVALVHNFNDTVSVRFGGAYNIDLDEAVLSLRAGAFYDSPTTDSPFTRVDLNTLPKIAGTVGVGYRAGPFSVNAAYAAIASVSRDVADGAVRPSNSAKGGASVDGAGKTLPVINNGSYSGFDHVVALGIEVAFDALFQDRPDPAKNEAHR